MLGSWFGAEGLYGSEFQRFVGTLSRPCITSRRLSRVIHETVSDSICRPSLYTAYSCAPSSEKLSLAKESPLIGKAGTKRPGTISELFDKLVKTVDNTYGKRSMVVNHPASLSKGKKMPPRRYNTP